MKWLFSKEITGEYWTTQALGGAIWAGGYDAITKVSVFGLCPYERVGRVYRVLGVVIKA